MPIDRKINKKIAATIIAVAALAIPALFIRDLNWAQIQPNIQSMLFAALYIALITGFIFLALDNKGPNITSGETDKKISSAYKKFQKKLTPALWFLVTSWAAWVGYLFYRV